MGNFIVSGAAVRKAGANVSIAIPELAWTEWISGAESIINDMTRYNWSDNYATLNDDTKHILSDTAASMVATDAIRYDMEIYVSISEAQSMISSLNDAAMRNISILRDIKTQTFMGV